MSIKNQKAQKKCVLKGKLKFQCYKNCLKANEIVTTGKYFEKNEMIVDFLMKMKENSYKKQRFESERHNVFYRRK